MNDSKTKTALLIFFLFVGVYYVFSSGHFYVADEASRFKLTQSLWDRQSIAIDDTVQLIKGVDGRIYSKYPPAPSVLALPLYAVGKLISSIAGSGGATTGVFFGSMFNQIVMALTCCVFFLTLVLLGCGERAAKLAAILFGLGTLALPYSRTFFGEPLAGLSFLLVFYFLKKHWEGGGAREIIAAGCFMALAIASQYTAVVLVAPFAVYLVSYRSPRGRRPRGADVITSILLFALPVIAVGMALLYYNYIRFGSVFLTGYSDETFSTPMYMGLYGFLFSTGKSLFLFCPLVLAVVPVLVRFYDRHSAEAKLIGACFLLYLLLHSKWSLWGGDLSWGPRYLVPMMPLIFLPLGTLLENRNVGKYILVVAFALGLLVNSLGTFVSFKEYYNVLYSAERPHRKGNDLVNFVPRYSPLTGHGRMLAFIGCRAVKGENCGSDFFNPDDSGEVNELMVKNLRIDIRIFDLAEKSRNEKAMLVLSYILAILLAGACAFGLRRGHPD